MDSLLSSIPSLLALISLRCLLPLAITLSVSWILRRKLEGMAAPSVLGSTEETKLSES